jgi:hypothetical protein
LTVRVRVVDHTGSLVGEGSLLRAWAYRDPFPGERECVAVSGRSFKALPSIGACIVLFDSDVPVPLSYGGSFMARSLDFSLPSGLHNVWGCGNDFDTDACSVHPDDRDEIMRSLNEA